MFEYLTGAPPIEGGDAAPELLVPGLAMRDAVVLDLLRDAAFSVTVATSSRAPHRPRAAMRAAARPGESAAGFVAREAARHDLSWVIAPETGDLLAQLHGAVAPGRWLGCDAAAIATASSKRATSAQLAAHGVATPLAFEHAPDVTRWVVKPDDGAGAVATRVHPSRASALADAAAREHEHEREREREREGEGEGKGEREGAPAVIEAWVDGEPLSLSLHCTRAGAELLSINRQRIHTDAHGVLMFGGVEINVLPLAGVQGRALQRVADAVARAIPGLRGFVGIDLVWHAQQGPVVIEVNPRLTCAYVGLSAALSTTHSRNLAAEVVAAHDTEHRNAHA